MHFQDNRFLSHFERFFYLKKKGLKKKKTLVVKILIGLFSGTIASLRRRCGNPVFPAAACLDCFAALAMTKVVRKS
jgi:hypothetical protein